MAAPNVKPTDVDYGSLSNTLTPAGAMSLIQAAEQEQMARLSQHAQQAAAASQRAQGQYQQEAAAPPPDIGGAGLIPSLFGNTASVLGGTPDYRREAAESITQKKAALLRARSENLNALHDIWLQRASESEKAGDLETTEKYRMKAENLSKVLGQVNLNVERQDKVEAQRRDLAAARERAIIGEHMDPRSGHGNQPFVRMPDKPDFTYTQGGSSSDTPPIGRVVTLEGPDGEVARYYDLEGATGDPKNAGLFWANQNGVPVLSPKEITVIQDIQGAKDNAIEILNQGLDQGIFSDSATQRLAKGPLNAAKRLVQANAPFGAYNTWRTAAIKALRATAGSGGLRINQAEIDLAIKNDLPLITDTREVAIQKMANIQTMLANAMRPYITSDWRRMGPNSVTIGARLPSKGQITMMDRDGAKWKVDVKDFRKYQTQGWARVMQDEPKPMLPSERGTSSSTKTTIRMSGTPNAYGPIQPQSPDQEADDLFNKYRPAPN